MWITQPVSPNPRLYVDETPRRLASFGCGRFLLNSLLGVFVGLFVWRNDGRRREILATLWNISDVWQLQTPGAYSSDHAILAGQYAHS